MAIVCINYDDQKQIELNVSVLKKRKGLQCACDGEFLMPRFYFNLASKDAAIPDDSGKELDTLNDAYDHARKLIQKILLHVGDDDAEAWKVIVLNDAHNAQMIVPFAVSNAFSAQRRRKK